MATYNDLTFNYGQYTPQYAGIPLEQIENTADKLSTRHYQNIARMDQLDILAAQMKERLLPGAKPYADQHINAINSAIQEIAKTGGENATARVSALARTLQGDEGLLSALQQAERVNKEIEAEQDILKQGRQPVRMPGQREAMMQASIDSELYKTPYMGTVQPFEEPIPHMESIWSKINPDSIESALRSADRTTLKNLIPKAVQQGQAGQVDLPLFFETVTRAGIGKGKIDRQLDNAWSSYQQTPAYKQQVEVLGRSPGQIKQEFYKHGLLRVFENISRDYRPTPTWADNNNNTTPTGTPVELHTPLPAKVREKFDPGFNLSSLNDRGEIAPSFLERFSLRDPFSEDRYYNSNDLNKLADEATAQGNTTLAKNFKERAERLVDEEKSVAQRTQERTKKMLPYMRAAMNSQGRDTDGMSDLDIQSVASTKEGKAMLENYMNTVGGTRFHAPFINNIVDEKIRKANEDFLRGNFSQRQFIDMTTGEHYEGLKDENGEVNSDLLELSKALTEQKVIMEGTVDPKHIFTEIDNAGDNFTRALRIQVPASDESGNMKEYLVSQLPTTTSAVDINENKIYREATKLPGKWSAIGHGVEVLQPATPQQKQLLWTKYGMQSGLTQEQFMSDDVVLVKEGNRVIPAANYTSVAQWLLDKGISLKSK